VKKQKILHILYSGLAGTTDYVFNLIKGDKEYIFEHHILFYGIEKVPDSQLALAKEQAKSVTFVSKLKGYDKSAFKKVLSLILKIEPNIITLHVNSLILTCAKYKLAKLVFVEHQANHLKTKKEWLWSAIAQQKSDFVICLTQNYQNQLKNQLKFFFKRNKNHIIKTGIVLVDYKQINSRENQTLKIGMISRINSLRDHKTLIEAFTQLNSPGIELNIVGDGPLLLELKDKYNQTNIIFKGHVSQQFIPKILSEFSIYCQASFGETSSIAIMQAQASGLPIIASNVKGIKNILDQENSILVEVGNVNSYKNAIELLVNDNEKRKILSEKSLAYASKNLSHFRMFDEYKKLLV